VREVGDVPDARAQERSDLVVGHGGEDRGAPATTVV
jgi:hypothetical protein